MIERRQGLARKVLKHISTTVNNETFGLARLASIFIIPVYLAMGWVELNSTPENRAFDFQSYGFGFATILGALALFLAAEEHAITPAEPAPKDPP